MAKWPDLLSPFDLADLQVSDFEVVDVGQRIAQSGCVRQGPVVNVPGLDAPYSPGFGAAYGEIDKAAVSMFLGRH